MSFAAIEKPAFRKFINLLHPMYKPPTRKTLASRDLSKVFASALGESQAELAAVVNEGGLFTLMLDSWVSMEMPRTPTPLPTTSTRQPRTPT